MSYLIGKSGTGIGKSGTGIGKSGTGIGKSDTAIPKTGFAIVLFTALVMTISEPLLAGGNPTVEVFHQGDVLMVSVQDSHGVFVGAASVGDRVDGYHAVELFALSKPDRGAGDASPMVKGSGSGASGDSVCKSGTDLMVKGSGSGDSGESNCSPNGVLMVKGSGSGSSGDSICDAHGELLVKGSGSGSSGESAGCAGSVNAWGYVEVVFDRAGAHVVVHQFKGSRQEEFLVAFLPGSNGEFAYSPDQGRSNRGFVATP